MFYFVTARGASLFGDVLPWLFILLVIVVVGFIIVIYIRRTITSDTSARGQGFTLQDLRDLHAAGQLSDEEFEQAKAAMIGRLTPAKSAEDPQDRPKKPGNGPEPQNDVQ